MIKNKVFRRLALLFSLIMLITSTVNTTYGYIVTQTDSLINTFTPGQTLVNGLHISKTVEHPLGEGYVIPDNISFDFQVNLGSLYANTTIKTTVGNIVADENGTITVSIKPGKSVDIEDIDEGTKVTVTEVQKDGSGFTVKDGAVKEATVSADGSVTIDFVNNYTPANVQPTIVTVSGTKVLGGREWQTGDTFSFLLEQDTGNGNWVSLGTKTITYDAENADFNKFDFSDLVQALTFDTVGTYAFRISEVVGNLENVDYDKTVNSFTIKVGDADMDGKLEVQDVTGAQNAAVTKDDEAGKYNVVVTFNNTFVPPVVPDPDDIAVTITVNKTVKNTGTQALGPNGFEFVLENVATGEKTALETDNDGKAIFNLPFTAADIGKTYNYTLSETNEGKQGVTYDAVVYNIQVAIALGEDNKLIATVTRNGTAVENCVAEFENTFHTEQEPSPPTGDNSNSTFWFIMMIISGTACVVLLLIDKRYRAGMKR